MDKFTQGIRYVEELYKESKYNEAIDECNKYLADLDHDDFDNFKLLSIFNNHLFNCYFRLSKEEECKWHLSECVRYATTDEETYKAFHNQIRLAINTGKASEVLERIEGNMKYYKSIGKTVSIADTLVLKGRATKDINCFKEAVELYKQCSEDTSYEIAFAQKQIKALRHLT